MPDTNPQETLDTASLQSGRDRLEAATEMALQFDARAYHLIEELGKGGMGEVHRAGDPALGRDLAIKVMKDQYRGSAEAERRFLREARITGSLQHPGIVAVHNLGRLADGRLHYTMRLVRGQTFAAILREEAGKPERWPYLLNIFERICQAVAYAHSKRVIHRDLKPSNVMVGRFGEVQVMDWGLAKVLTADDTSAESEKRTEAAGTRIHTESPDTPIDLSRTGSGMGTPSYMPPEQALGQWDAVDERADVFALGSILCEMLTGLPAYGGTDGNDVYRRARGGDVTAALERLQQCGADAALTALCRECLSPQREGRPRDAAVVAKRVAEYQAEVQERLRQAEVERAQAQATARGERKRRRLVIALLLVLLAGAAVSTWQAVRATAERDDKEIALGKERAAVEAERQAKDDEALQRKRAEDSQEDTKTVLGFFQDKVLSAGRPEGKGGGLGNKVTLRKAVDAAEPEIAKSFADRPLVEASIRNTLGMTYSYLGEYPQAIQQHERALALREAKLGSDHPDTLSSRNNLASTYLSAGRIADAIRLNEQNLKQREATLAPDHPDMLITRNNLAAAYSAAGRNADAIPLHEQNLKYRETRLGDDHPDTLETRNNLAATYWHAGRLDDALRLHEQTLKQREAKLGPGHPDTLISRNNLAVAYHQAGYTADSIRLIEQNLKQLEDKLGPDHPNTLSSRNNLAVAYLNAGRADDAVRLHEQTFKRRVDKLGPDHPDTLLSMLNLGAAYGDAGRLKDAISVLEDALQRARKRSGGLSAQLMLAPVALAEAYDKAGQFDKAEVLYRASLEEVRRQFGAEDLRTAGLMAELGYNLLCQHKYSDAEPPLRDCLKVRAAKQPDAWGAFNVRSLLGAALLGQKKYAEAEPLLLQGYEGLKAREAKMPPQTQVRVTEALQRLVQLNEAMGKKDQADKWRKKLDARKQSKKDSPK